MHTARPHIDRSARMWGGGGKVNDLSCLGWGRTMTFPSWGGETPPEPGHLPPWPYDLSYEQTDACENITLARFATRAVMKRKNAYTSSAFLSQLQLLSDPRGTQCRFRFRLWTWMLLFHILHICHLTYRILSGRCYLYISRCKKKHSFSPYFFLKWHQVAVCLLHS